MRMPLFRVDVITGVGVTPAYIAPEAIKIIIERDAESCLVAIDGTEYGHCIVAETMESLVRRIEWIRQDMQRQMTASAEA